MEERDAYESTATHQVEAQSDFTSGYKSDIMNAGL